MANLIKRAGAIQHLRKHLPHDEKVHIRSLIAKHGSKDWIHHLYDDKIAKLTADERARNMAAFWANRGHFSFGMNVRNGLRNAGFDEVALGVTTLDNIYVDLLNEAVIG